MKYTLKLSQGFPFASAPSLVDLDAEKILCNDVMLHAEIDAGARYNPNNIKLYVIGHEIGPICAVWASHDQDALDNACDANMLECLLSENQDYEDESLTGLGNASELHDLSMVWLASVEFNPARDVQLVVKFARASEAGHDTLDF